jgi:hypothetical protein
MYAMVVPEELMFLVWVCGDSTFMSLGSSLRVKKLMPFCVTGLEQPGLLLLWEKNCNKKGPPLPI